MKITDKDGATLNEAPLAAMESLSVLGSVQISTRALHALADLEVIYSGNCCAQRVLRLATMDELIFIVISGTSVSSKMKGLLERRAQRKAQGKAGLTPMFLQPQLLENPST